MAGEATQRSLSIAARAAARNARLLGRIQDAFGFAPFGLAYDELTDALDRCGHRWDTPDCDCPMCLALRQSLLGVLGGGVNARPA